MSTKLTPFSHQTVYGKPLSSKAHSDQVDKVNWYGFQVENSL